MRSFCPYLLRRIASKCSMEFPQKIVLLFALQEKQENLRIASRCRYCFIRAKQFQGPKNERFKCSSMNFFPRMQRCEIYNILAEPHGPGNLIVNDDVVYAEKFCLPSIFQRTLVSLFQAHTPNAIPILILFCKYKRRLKRTS